MKIVLFCHSLVSDWNHGNAHFLRGVVTEFAERGHEVVAYEADDAWSARNLAEELGALPLAEIDRVYPRLRIERYSPERLDLEAALDRADLVLVHEWNPHELVARVGQHRLRHRYTLLFHDTHHRSVTDPAFLPGNDLACYDGILAFGEAVRERYVRAGFGQSAFTWHEAADVRVFKPLPAPEERDDLVWIGNFGDGERTRELEEYLLSPVSELGLRARVYGVRYPEEARRALSRAGIAFGGYLPNHRAPEVFARHRVTVHVPRGPYARALPGVPTIRVFEALACGIPLVSAPWSDSEGLFRPEDFLRVEGGTAMRNALGALLADADMAQELSRRGLQTILARHTCAHRVDELLRIHATLSARQHTDHTARTVRLSTME